MKKLITTIFLLAEIVPFCTAQTVTNTKNSIVTTTPITALTPASPATTNNSIVQVDYFDGFGRPVQTVQVNGSAAGTDLATRLVYDKYGQVIENWLPVPASSNNGACVSSFNSKSKSAYNDSYAYTKTEYEPSPLARPLAVYSPGAEMKSHPATIKYATNYNMAVKKYAMSSKNVIVDKGTYANGSLFVKIEADQDGCTTQTFTDKLGNVILERRVNGSENYDTYYVYSNYDTYDSRYHHSKLCAVMPPGCNASNYAEAAYIYRYDERRRCIYKKIPGSDPVTYVYDNADRLTYSQDGEQRKRGVYAYYVYDQFGRITAQGECADTKGSNKTQLIYNYYDGYWFRQNKEFKEFPNNSVSAQGLKTGSIIKVLGATEPNNIQYEVYYYDYRGRLEKTVVKDPYGMMVTYSTIYNYNNQVTKQEETYSSLYITKTTTNSYDKQRRLTKESTTVNEMNHQATAQVEFVYSNVGRLGSKKIGTTTKTEINYQYNTQGQLLSAASTPFTEKLYYNNSSIPNAKNYFNGNISAIYWKHSGQSANTTIFDYDKLNRMTSSTNTANANRLTETGFTYDERGNISGFTRYDASSQPTSYYLTHSNANRLVIANTDKGLFRGFSYDANGNQTSAPNGLTITYNSINQPQQVKSGSTVKHKFAYLADGRKLLSLDKIKSNDSIDKDGGLAYIGSSVFIINEGKYDGFESTSFSAGRIVRNSSGAYAVQYHITDHLGSVRAVLNQSMTVLEQNDYYPFGLRHPNASLKTTANRYRYNGKEEIAADATSDYGARQYSAEFCQWLQVDPLAEKYYGISPYAFTANNPINNREIDGRYFDTENERIARRIEKRVTRMAEKLEAKANRIDRRGGNSGDLRERAGELRQSAQDVRDMRDDATTEYKYAKFDGEKGKSLGLAGPSTTLTGQNGKGDNVVTMFTEKSMGNQIHETRHGGQNARREFNVATGAGYGVADEVSAYRAQYSWDGNLKYIDINKTPTQAEVLNSLQTGSNPLMNTINVINRINAKFVNSLVDPGFRPIYPPASIPLKIWNSN